MNYSSMLGALFVQQRDNENVKNVLLSETVSLTEQGQFNVLLLTILYQFILREAFVKERLTTKPSGIQTCKSKKITMSRQIKH